MEVHKVDFWRVVCGGWIGWNSVFLLLSTATSRVKISTESSMFVSVIVQSSNARHVHHLAEYTANDGTSSLSSRRLFTSFLVPSFARAVMPRCTHAGSSPFCFWCFDVIPQDRLHPEDSRPESTSSSSLAQLSERVENIEDALQSQSVSRRLLEESVEDVKNSLRALQEQVQAVNIDDFVARCHAESRRRSPTAPSALSRSPSGSTCDVLSGSSTGTLQAPDTGLPSSKRYTLGETVWEAPAVVGRSGLPVSHSMNIVMAFTLNVYVQALFYVIAWKTFAEEGLPDVEDIKQWRYTIAHDVVWADSLGVSLAGRVCGGDSSLVVSAAQKELFDELSQYTSTFDGYLFTTAIPQGVLLCSVALVIWLLLVVDEWHALATFTVAMFFDVVDGVRLTVGWPRFLAMVLVAGLRLAISTGLFVIGVLWLLKTTSLEDIILNAAALHFVMDVDEVVFKTLMTKRVKELLQSMEFTSSTTWTGRWNVPLVRGLPASRGCASLPLWRPSFRSCRGTKTQWRSSSTISAVEMWTLSAHKMP